MTRNCERLLKYGYLFFPAHHRKPHVPATRQRCPDQFTLQCPDRDTYTHTHNCTLLLLSLRAFQPANMHRQVQNLQITPAGSNPFSRASMFKITIYAWKCVTKKAMRIPMWWAKRSGNLSHVILKSWNNLKAIETNSVDSGRNSSVCG